MRKVLMGLLAAGAFMAGTAGTAIAESSVMPASPGIQSGTCEMRILCPPFGDCRFVLVCGIQDDDGGEEEQN